MSLARAALLLAALAAVGVASGVDLGRRPLPWMIRFTTPPPTAPTTTLSPDPCRLPCSCVRLSRWTARMRAHCVVMWLASNTRVERFQLSPSVDEADFTRSRIRTIYPEHLNGLENIKVMRMEEVGLVTVTTNAFSRLQQLWSLSLARNHLSALPEFAFQDHEGLHHLSLRGNPLDTAAGRPLLVSDSLQVLDLAHCRVSALDADTFRRVPALRQLHLEGNALRQVPADAVAPLTGLYRLFLQANRLLFFPSDAIKKLPALLEVRLDNNTQMEGPVGPLAAPRLQRLSATGCALESLQPDLLEGAPELRYLELSGNRLRTLWLRGGPAGARLVLLDAADNPLACDCALRDARAWARGRVAEARVRCGSPPASWDDDAAGLDRLDCRQETPVAGGSAVAGGAAAALWVTLSLVLVLGALGAALLLVYRQELLSRYLTPEGRAAASSGIDVVPLEESRGDDAVSEPPVTGMQMGGGVAPWLQQ